MGEEAEDVLTSTNITTDEKKDYETVLGKFNKYFKVRKNVILERARFNLKDLYRLAETCEYGNMTSQMIRDHGMNYSGTVICNCLWTSKSITHSWLMPSKIFAVHTSTYNAFYLEVWEELQEWDRIHLAL